MINFNLSHFKGLNIFTTSKITQLFEKSDLEIDEILDEDQLIEEMKLSIHTVSK